jgi:RNA ligase (TIGR02306 family)
MERKLASLRRITSLEPIAGADRIELAKVDGWQSVVKKGEHSVGDMVVFAEIDSILPFMPWSEFLRDKNRPDKVIRLKTAKLRSVISQGVIFPITILDGINMIMEEGEDCTTALGITKYEINIPAQLMGVMKGNFPTHIVPKTDSERIQNFWTDYSKDEIQGVRFVARHKIDGSSLTMYYNNGVIGVCSRNIDLKLDGDVNSGNAFIEMFKKYNIEEIFKKVNRNIAIQAEMAGNGVQGNTAKIEGKEIRVFDVFDVDTHRYFDYVVLDAFCREHGLPQVTTLTDNFVFDKNVHDLDFMLKMTEQKYVGTDQQIEGLVFTPVVETYSPTMKGRLRFKVINPNYLMANE